VLDFTSALYLGLRHPSASLPGWAALTEGRPAALGEPPAVQVLADRLADLVRMPAVALFPSTLHLFLDLFDTLAREPVVLFYDQRLYPSVRWSVERAVGRGTATRPFDRRRVRALVQQFAVLNGRRPIVVTTGLCSAPGTNGGGIADLRPLLRATEAAGGMLVVDDTQALGVIGPDGGGVARVLETDARGLIVGTSLAKGFGVPLAALAGTRALVQSVSQQGPTRWHASPPSAAVLAAAQRALDINDAGGDRLRARLETLAHRLNRGLHALGLGSGDRHGLPVQPTRNLPRAVAVALQGACANEGLKVLLQRGEHRDHAHLTLLVTAAHTASAIDEALAILKASYALAARSSRFAQPRNVDGDTLVGAPT
jgi:8-amino-7-oxononanoate synthase